MIDKTKVDLREARDLVKSFLVAAVFVSPFAILMLGADDRDKEDLRDQWRKEIENDIPADSDVIIKPKL